MSVGATQPKTRGRWWQHVANQVGKRYQCNQCHTEMIVTKGGSGELACCGQPMQQK
jgi:desulfoferrodoxin-like iron-binding protein